MKNIYVTGFIGSDRRGAAERIAKERELSLVDLDRLIEESDGRKIMRIIMLMGEHEYRNLEYEMLQDLSHQEDLVVLCGDGVLFDEMCADLLRKGEVVIADADLSCEELWQKAKDDPSIPYAFMQNDAEDAKRERFFRLYESRRPLYEEFINLT